VDQHDACNQAVAHADVDAVGDERLPDGGRAIRGGFVEGQTGESRQEFGDEAALAVVPRAREQLEARDDCRDQCLVLEFEADAPGCGLGALEKVDENVGVRDHHRHEARISTVASRSARASFAERAPWSSRARLRVWVPAAWPLR